MACSGTALAFLTTVLKNTNKIHYGNVAKTEVLAWLTDSATMR
jgi:hypothetical protein